MSMVKKSITVTAQQDMWVKNLLAKGDYASDSEYFRELIRRDQAQRSDYQDLKTAIQDGIDSGESELSVQDIWAAAERRHRNRNG